MSHWLVRVPWAPPSLNAQLRMHWSARRKVKAQAEQVALVVATAATKAEGPRRVRFTRIAARRLDEDNLAGAYKSLRDVLARSGVVAGGDHPRSGNVWEYRQDLGEGEATVIEIEEIDGEKR